MLQRRDFLLSAASATALAPMIGAPAIARPRAPLRALPKIHHLYTHPGGYNDLTVTAEGPSEPQPLIRAEVLDRAFGRSVAETLSQPDHWRMIEEGWFSGSDLYTPNDYFDPAYMEWHRFHKPTSVAVELMLEAFPETYEETLMAYHVPGLPLRLEQHPCSPPYIRAALAWEEALPDLIAALRSRDCPCVVDPVPRSAPFEGGAA